jgi:hypothetical protein
VPEAEIDQGDHNQLVNLRDVGGLPLIGGGTTHAGILYRGDAPYPDDIDPGHLDRWPPAVVIDLRSHDESTRVGYDWPAGAVIHNHPLYDAAAPTREIPDTLTEVYVQMVETASRRIAESVAFTATSDGPVLVHCELGKDRTGVVIAVLLLAAGVEPRAVVDDYLATEENLLSLRRRLRSKTEPKSISGEARSSGRPFNKDFLHVSPEAIHRVVSILSEWPGGPTAWLIAHGAESSDVEAWSRRLGEPCSG